MNILILANNDIGLYKFRKELIQSLCEKSKVTLALPQGDFVAKLIEYGCKYTPVEFSRHGKNPIAEVGLLRKYIRLIKKENPDVVLTYTIKPNVYGGIASRITRTPYLPNITGLGTAVENGGILGFISKNLYRIGLKRADCVFFQNEENRKLLVEKGISRGKTRLIPGSGVNLHEHIMQEYPAESEITNFLFVGRIMKDKGIGELLQAMDCLSNEGKSVFLDVVGQYDEDYSEILKAYEDRGMIKYHGLQKDVRPFYKAAHCIVLPSYHEGMANVLLEAAATGRPVIATKIPGCQETFDEGVTGLGCEVRNADSLTSAMERFLALSTDERKVMGAKGRKKVEKDFDRQLIIDAYLDELKQIERKGE